MAAFFTPTEVTSLLAPTVPVATVSARLTFVTVLARALKKKSADGATNYSRVTGRVARLP